MASPDQRKAFFDTIRPSVNLTDENVPGFEQVWDYGSDLGLNREALAFVLATAYWESGKTMRPVKEAYWLSEDWRRKNLRYYPWYGRGLIQITWEANYVKIAELLRLPADTFTKNPDLMLEWEYALPALFLGMEFGIYTGKALDDYIDGVDEADAEDLREYANARRIVNGTDKQIEIGELALAFEEGLRAAGYPQKGYGVGDYVPDKYDDEPQPIPEPHAKPEEPAPEKLSWWERILGAVIDFILRIYVWR